MVHLLASHPIYATSVYFPASKNGAKRSLNQKSAIFGRQYLALSERVLIDFHSEIKHWNVGVHIDCGNHFVRMLDWDLTWQAALLKMRSCSHGEEP